MPHPREILLGAQAHTGALPVCDHYSGVEARMRKSLQLQAEMAEEFGACVFDVTLDCEDGAPVGGEIEQAHLVSELLRQSTPSADVSLGSRHLRRGARLHPVNHPAFADDVAIVVGACAEKLSYVMVPKVESLSDVEVALKAMDAHAGTAVLPLHVLIESPAAVHHAFAIAAHPRVQSLSFGLMDFVSAHAGAIPSSAMGLRAVADKHTLDQFHHPLVVRAKLEIASACHAHGKVPSHCVVTELRDTVALETAARVASSEFGFTRMWSIHPDQIRSILRAFAPDRSEVDLAARILEKACAQAWAPIAIDGTLHDRASYRYFWQLLERAQHTGVTVPSEIRHFFCH